MNTRIRWLQTEWPNEHDDARDPDLPAGVGSMGAVAIYSYVYAQRHLHVMEALSVMPDRG